MPRVAISSLYPVLPPAEGMQVEDPVDTDEVIGLITVANHLVHYRGRHALHRTIQHSTASANILDRDPGTGGAVTHAPIWWRATDSDRHVVVTVWYQAHSGVSGGIAKIEATLTTWAGAPLDDPAGLGPGMQWQLADGSLRSRQVNRIDGVGGALVGSWPLQFSCAGDRINDAPLNWPSRPRPLQLGEDGPGELLRLDLVATACRLLAVDVHALFEEVIEV